MKKLLLILGLCSGVNMVIAQDNAHSFQDSHHNLIGYVRGGSIIDQNNNFLGQFKAENQMITVLDSHHKTVGYIVKGNEFQNAEHTTVGYISSDPKTYDAAVQDAQHTVIGYVRANGTVETANHTVVGYRIMTEPVWAAAYFFLLKF